MKIDLATVSGIGKYVAEEVTVGDGKNAESLLVYKVEQADGKVFFVVRKNTIELRCDRKLSGLLREKYESVMESRYFGRGGIEIVSAGQLETDEIEDLIRLSYNLSK